MQAVVSEIVRTRLELAATLVTIEEGKAAVEAGFAAEVDELQRAIAQLEGGLQVWAAGHPEEFGDKKSIDLPSATFGFRQGPPKVEKVRAKETWDDIVARMVSIVTPDFIGEDYVRYGAPSLDKDQLLKDRDTIAPEVLKAAGIRFDQDEFFYFTPKSEVLESTSKEAA